MKELSQKQTEQLWAYQNDKLNSIPRLNRQASRVVTIHERDIMPRDSISSSDSEPSNLSVYEPIESIRRWLRNGPY